jgi:formate-dependent nitrite reductase membrane component NrfD
LQYADPNNLRVLLFATAHRILTHTGNVFSTVRLYEFQENSSLVFGVMGFNVLLLFLIVPNWLSSICCRMISGQWKCTSIRSTLHRSERS